MTGGASPASPPLPVAAPPPRLHGQQRPHLRPHRPRRAPEQRHHFLVALVDPLDPLLGLTIDKSPDPSHRLRGPLVHDLAQPAVPPHRIVGQRHRPRLVRREHRIHLLRGQEFAERRPIVIVRADHPARLHELKLRHDRECPHHVAHRVDALRGLHRALHRYRRHQHVQGVRGPCPGRQAGGGRGGVAHALELAVRRLSLAVRRLSEMASRSPRLRCTAASPRRTESACD